VIFSRLCFESLFTLSRCTSGMADSQVRPQESVVYWGIGWSVSQREPLYGSGSSTVRNQYSPETELVTIASPFLPCASWSQGCQAPLAGNFFNPGLQRRPVGRNQVGVNSQRKARRPCRHYNNAPLASVMLDLFGHRKARIIQIPAVRADPSVRLRCRPLLVSRSLQCNQQAQRIQIRTEHGTALNVEG